MGFTLRAALALLADDATVTVAELVPAVVVWARGPMAGLPGTGESPPLTHAVPVIDPQTGAIRDAQIFEALLTDTKVFC